MSAISILFCFYLLLYDKYLHSLLGSCLFKRTQKFLMCYLTLSYISENNGVDI